MVCSVPEVGKKMEDIAADSAPFVVTNANFQITLF